MKQRECFLIVLLAMLVSGGFAAQEDSSDDDVSGLEQHVNQLAQISRANRRKRAVDVNPQEEANARQLQAMLRRQCEMYYRLKNRDKRLPYN